MQHIQTFPSTRPYIEAYLRNRPPFFTLIRSQEAALFEATERLLRSPVLDFGCGDGFFAQLVYGKERLDVGLDLGASRIHEAEVTRAYRDVVSYDGRTIPFPAGHFGSAISNCVLEHVADVQDVVREIGRVVDDGGVFLTSVMTDRWEDYMLGARLLGDRYRTFMRAQQEHRNLLTRAQWDEVFRSAGFTIESTVGYLSSRTALTLDGLHYFSIPSLAARRLTGRWVVMPELWARLAPLLERGIELPVDADRSAALFYVLRRRPR